MKSSASIVIVGSGVGGLAAAIRMAVSGARVTLIEKNSRVGGKLNQWIVPHPHRPNEQPFTFDSGPSLLTMPLVFADLFAAAGRDVRDWLSIRKLDPVSKFVWADGQTFELRCDPIAMREQIARISPRDVDGFERFLAFGKHVWDLSGELFLTQSPEQAFRPNGAFSLIGALKSLSVPFRIGMFQKFAAVVNRHVRHPRLREVLYQYATYSGASPFLAPATLAVIPHVELAMGGWYVDGGLYTIASQLQKLAIELGVEIRLNTPADRVIVEGAGKDRRVTGVHLSNGEVLAADAVIVNADVPYAYRSLIAEENRPSHNDRALARLEPGGSGMVLLLGVDGTYPQLAHHAKFMPADYRSDLRAMFETRTIPNDPCIYVCASTRTDARQAPPGCENLFVLCSAPPIDGSINWAVEGKRYRDQIVSTLETRFGLTNLSGRIVVEKQITPADLQKRYNAHAGSIYGISSNGIRQAFLRPPNRDRDVKGLFFAGGATHPGGGLPLVALSGKIASELALEYLA